MEPEWLEVLALFLVYVVVTRAAFRLPPSRGPGPRALLLHQALGRLRSRAEPPRTAGRPLELIAGDARRLGLRFHHPPRGTSFVKLEGVRRAYDKVLAEACAALGVEHLLAVLPPGEELDLERARVENVLWLAGMRIDEAA